MASDGEGVVVCPGDRLGREGEDCLSGPGTHVWRGEVVASVLGDLVREYPAVTLSAGAGAARGTGNGRVPTASVRAGGGQGAGPKGGRDGVVAALGIGDEVLCRVKRLNPRYASCDITCRDAAAATGSPPAPLVGDFSGIIRVQDVRATEIDKVSAAPSLSLPPTTC